MLQAIGNVTCSSGPWWLDRLVFKLKKDSFVDPFEIRDQTAGLWLLVRWQVSKGSPRRNLTVPKSQDYLVQTSQIYIGNKKCSIYPLYAALPGLQFDSSLLGSVALAIKVIWFQKWHKKRHSWRRGVCRQGFQSKLDNSHTSQNIYCYIVTEIDV